MAVNRRHLLRLGASLPVAAALGTGLGVGLGGCLPAPRGAVVRWVGASADRGHRLRSGDAASLPAPARTRRAPVLVLGGGVAGLSALRALTEAGVADAQLLELEDSVGGNSRGHAMAGRGCPLGAHYLPVPGPAAIAVSAWLHDIGLLRSDAAGTHANERYLCHSPQERLFIDGAWQDGLLPAAIGAGHERPATLAQYRRFSQLVSHTQRTLSFALPTHAARWTPAHSALDAQPFAAWLAAQGLDDPWLLGHLDYCCRDDYGAGIATVSAWAGLHYFASRHGFHAPGDDDAERDAVFTWPEGNAFLVRELATPLQAQLQPGRVVLQVREERHGVQVLAWHAADQVVEAWTADAVIVATPLFIARRLLQGLDAPRASALDQAAAATRYAPWLVANLLLDEPLLARPGVGPAWDSVRFTPAGVGRSLGYVDAQHQSTRPDTALAGPQLLTAYFALPESQRPRLLREDASHWWREALAELAPLHPDLATRVQQVDLMRWGHAMSIPAPGVRSQAAREALRQQAAEPALGSGRRVRFAHADLAGYSVFEEAFTLGHEAGQALARGLKGR